MNAQINPFGNLVAIWSGRYDVLPSEPNYNMHYLSLREVRVLLSDSNALRLMDARYRKILEWAQRKLSDGGNDEI